MATISPSGTSLLINFINASFKGMMPIAIVNKPRAKNGVDILSVIILIPRLLLIQTKTFEQSKQLIGWTVITHAYSCKNFAYQQIVGTATKWRANKSCT